VLISLGTDSHSVQELDHMKYGVYQARRAWLEPDDVLNTRSWDQIARLIEEAKS
jgi:DNA polymerase (family 10)